jgi:hypothetical protein
MMIGRTMTGRIFKVFSEDRGHSWWPAAQPMDLMSSYSPARICRLPATGDLMIVWNQHSRVEIRKSLHRSRLTCAISKDEGKTWENFKNLEAIRALASETRIPPDPDLTPVIGDDEVGALPHDFAAFHYPTVSVVGEEIFLSYFRNRYVVGSDPEGQPFVKNPGGTCTRILPVSWFYA